MSDAVQSQSSLPDHVTPPATWGIARCKCIQHRFFGVFPILPESGDKATNRASANTQHHKQAQIHS